MNPILGQSTYGGPINKAGWKMSNIHATSKPNSMARDIFNRRDWREKRASALQLNESLKKSNNFTPRGPPRRTVARDPELYSPMYVRKGPGGNIQPPGPKTQSDIHGPISPRSNKYIPPPPPKIDTTIHGGNTVRETIYGHQSESLNQMAKAHEKHRLISPRRTSFVKQEHDRGMNQNDLLAIPLMKNAGTGIQRPEQGWGIREDPNIYGGNKSGQYPNFWPSNMSKGFSYNHGPKHRTSIEKQWRDVEIKSGNLSPRYDNYSGTRYWRGRGSEEIDRWAFTKRTDIRKYATNRPPIPRSQWAIKNTNPITGGSHYLYEYATKAVDPSRKRPSNGFQNFEDQSRKNWIRRTREHDKQMKALANVPPPQRGLQMRSTQVLMPHCPNGIYQWPQARKWGVSGMGFGGIEPGAKAGVV